MTGIPTISHGPKPSAPPPPLLFHVKRSPLGVTDSCRVHIADSYSSWPWNGAAALWSCGALTCSPHVRRERSTIGSSGLIGMHHPKAHSSTAVSRETHVLILPRDRAGRRVRPIARPRRLPWLHCASQHQHCGSSARSRRRAWHRHEGTYVVRVDLP